MGMAGAKRTKKPLGFRFCWKHRGFSCFDIFMGDCGTCLHFFLKGQKLRFGSVEPSPATLVRVAFRLFKSLRPSKKEDIQTDVFFFWWARRDLKPCYVNRLVIDPLTKAGASPLFRRPLADRTTKNCFCKPCKSLLPSRFW